MIQPLGFDPTNHLKQTQVDDSQPRGIKRFKEGVAGFNLSTSTPKVYDELGYVHNQVFPTMVKAVAKSYRETMMGRDVEGKPKAESEEEEEELEVTGEI